MPALQVSANRTSLRSAEPANAGNDTAARRNGKPMRENFARTAIASRLLPIQHPSGILVHRPHRCRLTSQRHVLPARTAHMLALPALPSLFIPSKTKRAMRTPTPTIRTRRRNPIVLAPAMLATPTRRHTPPSNTSVFPVHKSGGRHRAKTPGRCPPPHKSTKPSDVARLSPAAPNQAHADHTHHLFLGLDGCLHQSVNRRSIAGSTQLASSNIRDALPVRNALAPRPICGCSFSRIRDA